MTAGAGILLDNARGAPKNRPSILSQTATPRELLRDERGAEQMEYVLILACVVVPLVIAVRLFWAVLLFYFAAETLVVDLPFF